MSNWLKQLIDGRSDLVYERDRANKAEAKASRLRALAESLKNAFVAATDKSAWLEDLLIESEHEVMNLETQLSEQCGIARDAGAEAARLWKALNRVARNQVGAAMRTAEIDDNEISDSEAALLRMFLEVQAENERLLEKMPCGHPGACLIGNTDETNGATRCAWCESIARWRGLSEAATENAEGFRELFIESERRIVELEAGLRLAQMRATVGGGSVL